MDEQILGRCPACGGMAFTGVPGRWNVWECQNCEMWSTIREGQLELEPKIDLRGTRTEADLAVEKLPSSEVEEFSWSRQLCNLLHRGNILLP